MKKLYYEENERNFYWVWETKKTIKIDWAIHLSCDGSELDQKVRWKNLVVKKDNSGKHCVKKNDEDGILIYPFRSGNPFYLEPATRTHTTSEIASCLMWGVSTKYYDDLDESLEELEEVK
uniref:Uncharacterized protein n=1 Tax=viral metagenome TaxID=1070528 RepID=A0A6H1Z613_9ZZZZ